MADGLTREVDRLEKLWNDWEIRAAIVLSFFIQILLLVSAAYRKRNYGLKFKAVSLSISLWLEYLFADSVAIFALGYLSQNDGQVSHLVILWAPILLLHLGGQDNITALSVEDNELWKRHLLTFISQAGIAIYVFTKSVRPSTISWAGTFIFIAGIVKYVERIWALQKASTSAFRSSCTMNRVEPFSYSAAYIQYRSGVDDDEDYGCVVCPAYGFSRMFKPLFSDLLLDSKTWRASRHYFRNRTAEKAYKVIELELFFMYDLLHTKAVVLHKWYGWLFRISTLICTVTALVIFTMRNRIPYHKIEVGITYLLLVGAVVLESSSLALMLLSFWTYAPMKISHNCTLYKCAAPLKQGLMFLTEKFRPAAKSEWSNCMGQCSLLNYVVNCKSGRIGNVMSSFGLKEDWDNFFHTDFKPVQFELKKLVFSLLRLKIIGMESRFKSARYFDLPIEVLTLYRDKHPDPPHSTSESRQHSAVNPLLQSSLSRDFDYTILMWHIATDILLHSYDDRNNIVQEDRSFRGTSDDISKYMLFLLIARPSMLPSDIGQIRFEETCRHAQDVLRKSRPQNLQDASIQILKSTNDSYTNSVLPDGVLLAQELQKIYPIMENSPNIERMWRLISVVWMNLLCLAAAKSGSTSHTKQLSMGGEFLTHVFFLMAHLGIGDYHRFETKI